MKPAITAYLPDNKRRKDQTGNTSITEDSGIQNSDFGIQNSDFGIQNSDFSA